MINYKYSIFGKYFHPFIIITQNELWFCFFKCRKNIRKSNLVYIFAILFLFASCGGSKKAMRETVPPPAPVIIEEPIVEIEVPSIPEPVIEEPVDETPITEVIERLVPVAEIPPAPDHYFVILGSFRNHNNALNFQDIIKKEGFGSVLLRSEKGFYRVSVMSTNEIMEARDEIRRIRTNFPGYKDVWLLIQER